MKETTHEPIETLIERLMKQYGQEVYKMAYLYVKDKHLAEDVFQEVFFKVYKNYDKFQHQSSEKTWLIRITINTSKDLLRTSWLRRVTAVSTLIEDEKNSQPAYDMTISETNHEIYEAISQLPDKYKEVILLYYYKDATYEEIAQILNIPQGTVQSRMSRGKEKLKKILKQ